MNQIFKRLLAIATLVIAGTSLYATPASAQASRTWVSGVGDDANPCSRTAPCKTFAGTISKTAAGGEINCLDPGGWGAVTITKSITIDCSQFPGSILNAGTNGINVSDSGAGTIIVVIRGLEINAASPSSPGINGIRFTSGASLTLEDVVIRGNTSTSGYGISFQPSTSARLVLKNVVISNNGNTGAGTGGGILINPTGTGGAVATLDYVQIVGNGGVGMSISASGLAAGATLYTSLNNVTMSGNQYGLASISPPSTRTVMTLIRNSTFVQNTNYGIMSNGSSAQARVSGTLINGNNEGIKSNGGGFLLSYGDNILVGNATDGTWSATLTKS